MANQRILSSEEMVGYGHPTKADTLNRLFMVKHDEAGGHTDRAASGANTDITSLEGLTTPLSKAQGGSGTTGDSIVKGWIQFNGTGTIAIQDSFNVTSITDNGTGDYTVTWDTDFANDKYAATASCGLSGAGVYIAFIDAIATGTVGCQTLNTVATNVDPTYIGVIAIGDQ